MIDYYDTIEEEYNECGKEVFEAKYIFDNYTYNPENKMFEKTIHCHGGFELIESRTFTDLKYNIRDYTLMHSNQYKETEHWFLYEGLTKTVDFDTAIDKLKYYVNSGLILNVDKEINPMFKNKTPHIIIVIEKQIYDILETNKEASVLYNELLMQINNLGYYISKQQQIKIQAPDTNSYDCILYTLEPKFIIDVTDIVYDKFDGILYHITLSKNIEKIKNKGFIPRNSKSFNFDYPDRVYMFTRIPPDNFKMNMLNFITYKKKQIKQDLEKSVNDYMSGKITLQELKYKYNHRYDYNSWIIIKVNLKDKRTYIEDNNATKYRFFDDPNSLGGIFTYENIDPLCLNIQKEIKFDDKDKELDNIIPDNIKSQF